ncbi:MAG: hypothetical protein R2695_18720 [Acidimicrobiales bacterium]
MAAPVTLSCASRRSSAAPTPPRTPFIADPRDPDRLADRVVAGAAAQIAGQAELDLLVGGRRALRQQRVAGDEEAGDAEPALHGELRDERLLEPAQLAAVGRQPCHRDDLGAIGLGAGTRQLITAAPSS